MTTLQRTPGFVDGEVSFWFRAIGTPALRPPLPGDLDVDVAIVGAGFTGLWTAYYLKRAQPDLRIAVLEREFAGFGASGRNGGWLTAEPVGHSRRYAVSRGRPAVVALQRELFATIDEVVQVADREGIDAGIVKDGALEVATNPAQLARLGALRDDLLRYGWGEDDIVPLTATETRSRVNVAGVLGSTWTPHCARVQPAALVRGLADAVERLGVAVYEGTAVTEISPGLARTDHGVVRATHVVRALEGFTPSLASMRRVLLPMFSTMIVTEPLPDPVRRAVGWDGGELVGDAAHAFAYLQRTADGRIALGGRASPYRFGSRGDIRGETTGTSIRQLRAVLARLFPDARSVGVDHAWTGVLGVPRDWCASVGVDRDGLAWAGGYVGHGVAGSNLAARTLTDLLLRRGSDLTRLPWVDHRVGRWEPEPIRWLAVHGLYAAYRAADRRENASTSARTSWIARAADVVSGR